MFAEAIKQDGFFNASCGYANLGEWISCKAGLQPGPGCGVDPLVHFYDPSVTFGFSKHLSGILVVLLEVILIFFYEKVQVHAEILTFQRVSQTSNHTTCKACSDVRT